MFRSFWGSQGQEAQPRREERPTNLWYPPYILKAPSTSRPGTPNGSTSSDNFGYQRLGDCDQSPSLVMPLEAASMISLLEHSQHLDELRELVSDKDAYHQFLNSVDQVKIQNNLREELRKEILQLARQNLEKEHVLKELRNQCRIICTSELAAAEEKLYELEKQKKESLQTCAPTSLLHRLAEAINKADEESVALKQQLFDGGINMTTFVQKYKKLRYVYHRRALTHLAAKVSIAG